MWSQIGNTYQCYQGEGNTLQQIVYDWASPTGRMTIHGDTLTFTCPGLGITKVGPSQGVVVLDDGVVPPDDTQGTYSILILTTDTVTPNTPPSKPYDWFVTDQNGNVLTVGQLKIVPKT
jgi:hypothetical protein